MFRLIERGVLVWYMFVSVSNLMAYAKASVYTFEFRLGTVVPRYEGCRERLDFAMKDVRNAAEAMQSDTLFVFGNLDSYKDKFDGLDNVTFISFPNQAQLLLKEKPDCFIFHGGGNSYSEAIAAQVPCVVCPFFGDQHVTQKFFPYTYDPYRAFTEKEKTILDMMKIATLPPVSNNGPIVSYSLKEFLFSNAKALFLGATFVG